ncbi:PH domain-containing protein [Halobellus ruber]|uniref:PH domain-containing protein n=1 Tax=Halobellus ruber TaxID=2761102 RepID=A0A7J9SN66_9EURY|nr:PH domain-containing protein [Halobellus ruber]MBB6646581.1 PH domain-containing protein [Halobellus ruber]
MSDEWWFRDGDERVVWRGQPRLSAALGGVGAGVVVCALAIGAAVTVDPRIALGCAFGVGIAVWAVLRVRRTAYVLTTRALWLKRGVLGHTVRRVGLSKVQNTAYAQSATGSLFGYGTVTVDVAGGDDLRLRRVEDPRTLQEAIAERAGRSDGTVPGSTEQWQSVLGLLREIRTAVE